ncbi:MAG: hypothetical protein AB7W16_17415 [Candidatus Obscuribacterales bacterium]
MNKRQRELENREIRYWKKLIEDCQGQESVEAFCERNNVTICKFATASERLHRSDARSQRRSISALSFGAGT